MKEASIVCSMYTESYADLASRMIDSCKRFKLETDVEEVPSVHKSISTNGSDDLQYTKPAFISRKLEQHCRPLIYLDCDVVIKKNPLLLRKKKYDFMIYNWLADKNNRAVDPVTHELYATIPIYAPEKLMCSGAVQYYAYSAAAMKLLDAWYGVIERTPEAEDDHALDYAFNKVRDFSIRSSWLPKTYCRYAFWPNTKAVIDHPQMPARTHKPTWIAKARV